MVKKHIPPRSESGMAAFDVTGLDEADKKSSKKKKKRRQQLSIGKRKG
jgi:hypothetical protein